MLGLEVVVCVDFLRHVVLCDLLFCFCYLFISLLGRRTRRICLLVISPCAGILSLESALLPLSLPPRSRFFFQGLVLLTSGGKVVDIRQFIPPSLYYSYSSGEDYFNFEDLDLVL